MLRRILIFFLAFSLAVLALAFILAPPYLIEITEDQIAEELAKNLPYQVKKGALVTVQSATVQLSNENKIVVNASFDARGLTLEGTGTANVDSTVRYDKGRFFLSELKHDNVAFEFSENSDSTISDVRTTLEGILQRETEEANESADQDRIQRMSEVNEYSKTALRVDALNLLDMLLGSFPIYDLNRVNDSRFKLAALALDDVDINEERILVKLSLQQLITNIARILGTCLLIVVFFLGPERTIWITKFLSRLVKGKNENIDF